MIMERKLLKFPPKLIAAVEKFASQEAERTGEQVTFSAAVRMLVRRGLRREGGTK